MKPAFQTTAPAALPSPSMNRAPIVPARRMPDIEGHGDYVPYVPPPPAIWVWLQTDFPWLASPLRLAVAAVLVLVLVMAGRQGVAWLSQTPVVTYSPAQRTLNELLVSVEEARGREAMLVVLQIGADREAAISALEERQRDIARWLADHGAWLVEERGKAAAVDLHRLLGEWQSVQQQVVRAGPAPDRVGQADEARNLSTGPSAELYRRIVRMLEGMVYQSAR